MKELSENHIEKIIGLLETGKPLPEHYKDDLIGDLKKLKTSLLFDPKKEYELIYSDKEREEDILADTMDVPLQKVKTLKKVSNLIDLSIVRGKAVA